MNGDLLNTLQMKMDSFSKGQRLLAKYIVESYEIAAFLTASKLGETVGISESTVVRFAGELGFDGYPGLQKAMQNLVHNKMSSGIKTEDIPGEKDIISEYFYKEMENLRQTAIFLDRGEMRGVVDAMKRSKKIYIIGNKMNSYFAEYLSDRLQYLFNNVQVITQNSMHDILEKMIHVGSKDLVIGIDFIPYSDTTENALKYSRGTGATVIAFTDIKSTGYGKYCDHVLLAKCERDEFAVSVNAPFCLINALITVLAVECEDVLADNLSALKNACKAFNE